MGDSWWSAFKRRGRLPSTRSTLLGIFRSTRSAVDDDYRYRYIRQVDSESNFGDETYFGQDFIFRSGGSDAFVIGTPCPYRDKTKVGDVPFKVVKARLEAYADLGRALDVVRTFECDLFASSLVPIIIAHRHASISRVPGGKVLDVAGLAAFAAGRLIGSP